MINIESKATKERDGFNTSCAIDIDGCKLEIACEIVGIMTALEEKHPDVFSRALDIFLRERGF